jgi:hypothetical protein
MHVLRCLASFFATLDGTERALLVTTSAKRQRSAAYVALLEGATESLRGDEDPRN